MNLKYTTMSDYLCVVATSLTIITGGLLHAYVFDVEYISPETRYEIERSESNRSTVDGLSDFPSFETWLGQQENSEKKMNEYLAQVYKEFGQECAATLDPWWEGSMAQKEAEAAKPMSAQEWQSKYGKD